MLSPVPRKPRWCRFAYLRSPLLLQLQSSRITGAPFNKNSFGNAERPRAQEQPNYVDVLSRIRGAATCASEGSLLSMLLRLGGVCLKRPMVSGSLVKGTSSCWSSCNISDLSLSTLLKTAERVAKGISTYVYAIFIFCVARG